MKPSGYAAYLAENGGFATCGEHLGVMVADESNIVRCPMGWVFVSMPTTAEFVQKALDHARQGRAKWPTKEPLIEPRKEARSGRGKQGS